MFEEEIWNTTVAAAKAGDLPAAVRLAEMLMEWTEWALDEAAQQDSQEIIVPFVQHLFRDNFTHLPEGELAGIEAYLHASLATFLSDRET